jgi:hypothetical protein
MSDKTTDSIANTYRRRSNEKFEEKDKLFIDQLHYEWRHEPLVY